MSTTDLDQQAAPMALNTIDGVILTAEGEPVEGLFVASQGANGYVERVLTNSEGYYKIRGQATNTLFITTSYGNGTGGEFPPMPGEVLVDLELPIFNLSLESAFASSRRVDIDLPRTVRIRSTVKDTNGKAVAGALVAPSSMSFQSYTTMFNGLRASGGCMPAPTGTRSNGRARSYSFETTGFSMTASFTWPGNINVSDSQPVPDLAGQTAVRLKFSLDTI